MVVLLGIGGDKPMRGGVVDDDAVRVRVVMRIEAMRHRQCHHRHQKRRGGPTCSSTECNQHRRLTIEALASGVKLSPVAPAHANEQMTTKGCLPVRWT